MKKTAIFLLLSLLTSISFAQNDKEYKAIDGYTYKIGDTITLNVGSAHDKSFNFLQMGGFFNAMTAIGGNVKDVSSNVGRNYAGLKVVVKKIKYNTVKGSKNWYLVVGGGNITNYNLLIDQAIDANEVFPKGMTSDRALIELKKAKDKLDLGLITSQKYDSLKVVYSKYIN